MEKKRGVLNQLKFVADKASINTRKGVGRGRNTELILSLQRRGEAVLDRNLLK